MSSPIEDYAIVGDGQTVALVNRTGSIDWLCWPQFDSDACFAALLGTDANGRWSIAPKTPGTSIRRYKGDTLILETDIEGEGGTIRVTDFMPIRSANFSSVVRRVEIEPLRPGRRAHGSAHALRLRRAAAVVRAARQGDVRQGRPASAHPRIAGRHQDRGRRGQGRFHPEAGHGANQLRAELFHLDGPDAEIDRSGQGLRRDGQVLDRVDEQVRLLEDQVAGGRQALADHAAGHGPFRDRRPDRRPDDEPSRGARRQDELGLSLLLAARLVLHARRSGQCRLPRRGKGLARLAAARARRRPFAAAHHVPGRRLAASRRVGREGAAGLPQRGAGPHRQRRLDAAPDRRLRRGARLPQPRAQGRHRDHRSPQERRARHRRRADQGLGHQGLGRLGIARPSQAVHLFQGDGLGRPFLRAQGRRRLPRREPRAPRQARGAAR